MKCERYIGNSKNNYPNVFSDKISSISDYKVAIVLKEDSIPTICKSNVKDEELNKMEKDGTISPVDQSNCKSPNVLVPKKNKEMRITEDYKNTVNRVINVDVYPFLHCDDILNSRNGDNVFAEFDLTELDLTKVYQLLENYGQSKPLFAVDTHVGVKEDYKRNTEDLSRLSRQNVRINLTKSLFFQKQVNYLDFRS